MKKNRKTRKLKVYGQSGYKYQDTPTIILKGKWLEDSGFRIGDTIEVVVSSNSIKIIRLHKLIE